MSKVCKECTELKEISSFPINYRKGEKVFYRGKCKDCYRPIRKAYEKTYNKQYYENRKNNSKLKKIEE